MYQEQMHYQKEVEKEAKRLGVPEGCISLYSFGSSCVAYDYAGTPEESFAKFYNFDLLKAQVRRYFTGLDGSNVYGHGEDIFKLDIKRINKIKDLCYLYTDSSCQRTHYDELCYIVRTFLCKPFNIADKDGFEKEYFSPINLSEEKLCDFLDIVCDSNVELYVVDEMLKIKL